jgi:hypothetical protein
MSQHTDLSAGYAAAASLHETTLVHSDPHFQAIPMDWLKQEMLTDV